MSSKRWPTAFAKAESGVRQIVLQLGLGPVGFVLVSLISATLFNRISSAWAERLGGVGVGLAASAAVALDARAFFGYLVGRLTHIRPPNSRCWPPVRETFSLLLTSAVDGFDSLLENPLELVARLATRLTGMALTLMAVRSARPRAVYARVGPPASPAAVPSIFTWSPGTNSPRAT